MPRTGFNISTYTGLPEKNETLMTTLNSFNIQGVSHPIGSWIALNFNFLGKSENLKRINA